MKEYSVNAVSSWMILPPGNIAILRFPADNIPEGARLATATELLVANQGKPFPWGALPHAGNASRMWKEHRIGVGGLIHDHWFVTKDGRFGGAPNVPDQLPGSLRCCMFLDGGPGTEEENEGYAVVKEVSQEDAFMYRQVQQYSAERVMADGGAIVTSPLTEDNKAYVGFVGRCMICPNQNISLRALQTVISSYRFILLPEWQTE